MHAFCLLWVQQCWTCIPPAQRMSSSLIKVDLRNFAEDWVWRLMNLPVTQRIVIKFCWDAWTQKMVDFTRYGIGCCQLQRTEELQSGSAPGTLGTSTPQNPCAVWLCHRLTVSVYGFYLFINIQWLDVEMTSLICCPPIPAKLPVLLALAHVQTIRWYHTGYLSRLADYNLIQVRCKQVASPKIATPLT